ncbi:hypothetical protein LIER_16612 [Lithospermum erythrorhizon]|uniref:Uncharacterized protein n=1 Tax=Lithospermum erythrorhizon TaxID=34254 RepID=A0AAV3Q9U1_LITER
MRGSLGVLIGSLLGATGAPRLSKGARALRDLVLTPEISFPYLPLYSLPYHDFILPMADKTPTNTAGFIGAALGTVQSILREVRLARLFASMGGSYLSEGKVSFSLTSSPLFHYSRSRVVVVPDPSNIEDDTHESGTGNHPTLPLVEETPKRLKTLLPP